MTHSLERYIFNMLNVIDNFGGKMKKRAIVFGGRTGLLGQSLMRVLMSNGWHVIPLGRSDGDLLDISFIEKEIDKHQPQYIFNTVAWTQVDEAEEDERSAFVLNRALPAALAQIVKARSMHLIHYSTDFVFSGNSSKCYTEDIPTDPMSVYGLTKRAGEEAVLEIAPDNSCVLRTAWLFGPGRKNFVTTILNACHKNEQLSVVHDQIGSPTYSMDLASWSMKAAELSLTGIYHAVNSGRASWCELACEAVSIAEAPCKIEPITSDQWPQKAVRPPFSVLNATKLSEALNISFRPWPQALREFLYSEYLNRDSIGA